MKKAARRRLPKYVVEYEVPKGSGKWFVYFRLGTGGGKKRNIRMHGTPYSDEWMKTYYELLAGENIPEAKLHQPPTEQTFGWLCQQYLASSIFLGLDARTQRVRRQILQSCMDEPTKPGAKTSFGSTPLRSFTAKAVSVLRDRKADKHEAANGRIKAVRAVYKWGGLPEVGIVNTNPARDVQYKKSLNPEGHHAWTIDEIEAYEDRHPVGTKARLALGLLLYTAQRRGDIVLMGKQHEKDGWLTFTQQKNKRNKPVHLTIPIRPELRLILDASPLGDVVYLVNEFNRPFTANGFGNWFRKRCDEAGLPQCAAHGLRKAAATRLADNGATPHEIMAITGHGTLKEIDRYTKSASQKRLAKSASERG